MSTLEVRGARRLSGRVVAPPDKSISHRALILAALGDARCRVHPLSSGADNRSTLAALRALDVMIEVDEARREAIVSGVGGPLTLAIPPAPIDCGNSGTTIRMLAGVAAAMHGAVTFTGDASLQRRPMDRLRPLEAMGARVEGVLRDGKLYPPITIHGAGGDLAGATHHLPIASAQVKSALLLAGLWARGETVVHEPGRSRDHTERMLAALGAEVYERDDGAIVVHPLARPWHAAEIEVAPDFSSAAFLLAAALVTGSEALEVEAAVNPTRTGFLDVLAAFGAEVALQPLGDRGGEPVARMRVAVSQAGLHGAEIAGELTLRAIDEIPVIAGIAAFVRGRTVIRDAAELRVKESDRIASMAAMLRAFGAEAAELPDGLVVEGDPSRLAAAEVDGGTDHRLAMTAAVIGLGLAGTTRVRGAEVIDVSYPGFARALARVGAEVGGDVG